VVETPKSSGKSTRPRQRHKFGGAFFRFVEVFAFLAASDYAKAIGLSRRYLETIASPANRGNFESDGGHRTEGEKRPMPLEFNRLINKRTGQAATLARNM
jgi:hypothetical protein